MRPAGSAGFGDVLRDQRRRAQLTQEELAERSGLSRRTISDLERGLYARPHRDTIRLLAKALELAPDDQVTFFAAARPTRVVPATTTGAGSSPPLPLSPTTFVGREREVAAVRARLLDPTTQLLTLAGAGGTGKTRLAVEIARGLRDTFPQGVVFVDLAPLTDAELVLPTIAEALRVSESRDGSLKDSIRRRLEDQNILMILDNFEQVVDAAPLVSDLLATCPQVRMLVTSRTELRLRGERVYVVPPLALPELSPLPPLEQLTRNEAVRLFIERARDVRPDFAVTHETASVVAEICSRLDGLPLAIELAAPRVRLLAPHALLGRLSNRLELLTGGARDLPARQQTLRATIDWSYSLLDEAARSLFVQLSVFAGGCSLEAIEAVCGADGALNLLPEITALIEWSLLHRVGGEEPRFTMLETLRAYGLERLRESDTERQVRDAHAGYFLHVAQRAQVGLEEREDQGWLDRLQAEHENIRAALRWLFDQGETERALLLAIATWYFWMPRGHAREACRWLEAILSDPERVSEKSRARGLLTLGLAFLGVGEHERAVGRLEESLLLFQRRGDVRRCAQCWQALGRAAFRRRDFEAAHSYYHRALAAAREVGDEVRVGAVLHQLAVVEQALGQYERAILHAEESLALARRAATHPVVALALNQIGCARLALGDPGGAVEVLDEGVQVARLIGNRIGHLPTLANILNSLGMAELESNQPARSAAHQRECLEIGQGLEDRFLVAYGLEGLALVAEREGQAERAARLWGAAEPLRSEHPHITPYERDLYTRSQERARAQVGDSAFDAAWREGRALSMGEAVQHALDTS